MNSVGADQRRVAVARATPPIIAFFGTKGGVGKTTLINKFADLVCLANSNPKVLLVDFDVDARGSTIVRTQGRTLAGKTVHDYIASRSSEVEDVIDVADTVVIRSASRRGSFSPHLYLMPSATPAARQTIKTAAEIDPAEMLKLIRDLIGNAVSKYGLDCVLIDCGPIIDSYTATAAHLADRAFIIGQNEPISYEALRIYIARIRENYHPDFDGAKMSIILNKVRAVPGTQEFFAVVPFTLEVVDVSEGLADVDEVRLTLLDSFVLDILRRTLGPRWEALVPDARVLLSDPWLQLLEVAPKLRESARFKVQKVSLWVAIGAAAVFMFSQLSWLIWGELRLGESVEGGIRNGLSVQGLGWIFLALALGSGFYWHWHRAPADSLAKLVEHGERFLLSSLRKKSGRHIMESLRGWAEKQK